MLPGTPPSPARQETTRAHADAPRDTGSAAASPPSLALPKGGGAIRGIGEKFAANPVTGTGSMSVPIAISPGRSGFGPQLSLAYDSGAGNGPFGVGWSLSLASITRKTDKGLPQYFDAHDSDVFILSGAEDLVPVLQQNAQRAWVPEPVPSRTVEHVDYHIQRYRPRIEGLFARIERWTSAGDASDVRWRTLSKDNITTWYGTTRESRIYDPANPQHIFSWLICESYDDKGNAIVYTYEAENDANVDPTRASEHTRVRTAHRYLKRIRYGNHTPYVPVLLANAPWPTPPDGDSWYFEVVFDYDEGHLQETKHPDQRISIDASAAATHRWRYRADAFSSYRAGFEVRTSRLCHRVLMFHHFAAELGTPDCLVRSTDFAYTHQQDPNNARDPIYTFLREVTHSGYKRNNGEYLKRSLPPVAFTYSQPMVQETVENVDAASLENLPIGVDGAAYQWTDLHGEGIPGILTEQAGAWFYKRNISPISARPVAFAPLERVAVKPNLALAAGAQFMDLAGDGQLDLVVLDGPMPGFYEHDGDEGWQHFRPFSARLNRDMRDPNLKFVDLDGDGHADVLITEDDALVWHPALAEEGFGPARRVYQALDEEHGPRLVFADGTQSIYLADLSGDGLTDLARIRNGEICYWPNLGYGRFGAKVTMDNAPDFDQVDQFDHQRIRLADIDGSGTTDLIYLHRDGVRLYFNQSGNGWSAPQVLNVFPRVDEIVSIVLADLLGNGTACLVWSSPLPGDAGLQMRYVNLMGAQKPHLLIKTVNNLGAETRVEYAPSTKFYLQDKRAGTPWITKLPFPVHVVERVETHDQISGNRFVTRYAYHHGFFDGQEREFRGFGMVEQWDTEAFAALTADGVLPEATNIDAAAHVPPVLTKTWFHTGVYLDREHISDFFAGRLNAQDKGEYYRAPGLADQEAANLGLSDEARRLYDHARAMGRLLDDTILPGDLTLEEEREACRALKGAMLRQEVYALDGTAKEPHPYTVTEQNFTVKRVQPRKGNRHGVFFTHAREAISYHYERNPSDPRIGHALTLAVDGYGNVLRSIAVGYPRANVPEGQPEQNETHLTLTLNRFANRDDQPDWYRIGLPVESRIFEVVKPPRATQRFTYTELSNLVTALIPPAQDEPVATKTIPYEQWDWRDQWDPQTEPGGMTNTRLRLIEHVRTRYRNSDLTELLPLGMIDALALPGESYKLALTPGLLAQVFKRTHADQPDEALLSNPATLLEGQDADQGGYVVIDGSWWIPTGRVFYSDDPNHTAVQELTIAQAHFFLPQRYRDPFGHDSGVIYDGPADSTARRYDLLVTRTSDALGNILTAVNDYRVLQPRQLTDPNGNRAAAAFDALGMVVATAVMGKPGERLGDLLEGFDADPALADLQAFIANPQTQAASLLGNATTRVIYDLDRYQRVGQPPFAATLARETHFFDPGGDQTKIQISFSYSDGFGREIQKKIQAEAGIAPQRQADVPLSTGDIRPGDLLRDAHGELVSASTARRWVGSGRTVFNNKGKPVRQYEPFFSATHLYEPEREMTDTGVSPILFYDPAERAVATLHPNHTYEKVVFDPWQQETWDVNDTITLDPRTDTDIAGYVAEYFKQVAPQPNDWKTWLQQRSVDPLAPPPDTPGLAPEKKAAVRTLPHADTPTLAYFDTLGRPFLTLAHNGFTADGTPIHFPTRIELDIEGNQREVRDANDRIVMRYDYDMLGSRIHQASMEAGARWTLNDVAGKPIRAWDSRSHNFITSYDALRRPVGQYVLGTTTDSDPRTLNSPHADGLLVDKIEYGEPPLNVTPAQEALAQSLNLRTRIYRHFDSAGVATNARLDANGNPLEAYDFKGNLLRSMRSLISDYKAIPDWLLSPQLDAERFEGCTRYDALNRPIQLIAPHSNQSGAKRNVVQPVYNDANLLERVHVWLDHPSEPIVLLNPDVNTPSPVGVSNIDYDAKGQRQRIEYKNGATTRYTYDPETFRLIHLYTRRSAAFTEDCGDDPPPPRFAAPDLPPPGTPCGLQNLHYTYDPVGNITDIRDDAQPTIYFAGQVVAAHCDYTYDAIYRLITATGREQIGQAGQPETTWNDEFRVRLPHPGDGQAMRNYTEAYAYDAVGNFEQLIHHVATGNGWTRRYTYDEDSLTEPATLAQPAKKSNRLSSTTVGSGANSIPEPYTYDAHGNMTRMNHLPLMRWDYRDQLQATAQQVITNGVPETTWYVYDASGQRVRKVTERAVTAPDTANGIPPKRKNERMYLGGFEIYRDYENDGVTPKLERETLHIMDDKQRIALVETQTLDSQLPTPNSQPLVRYQFGNHLGSASLELDDQAQIISYEEYTPYGSTAYQAVRSQTETPKRYRYTGMERDEESGLNHHGARYYAPWLGRWASCDPAGLIDGVNAYAYVLGNPVTHFDATGRAAADWARKWEGQRQEYYKALGPLLTPETSRAEVAGLAIATLAVELGAGLVDLAYLGEGAAEGSFGGYVSDTLRVAGIATLAWGVAKAGLGSRGVAPKLDPAAELPPAKVPAVDSSVPAPPAPAPAAPAPAPAAPAPAPAAPLGPVLPPRALPSGSAPRVPIPRVPGQTVDPATGHPVGRFIVGPRGNILIEPVGGHTVPAGPGGVDTHTLYPNRSNYHRLNPVGHQNNPTPHGHGHLLGTGPGKAGQGASIDPLGRVVPFNSPDAHWPIR